MVARAKSRAILRNTKQSERQHPCRMDHEDQKTWLATPFMAAGSPSARSQRPPRMRGGTSSSASPGDAISGGSSAIAVKIPECRESPTRGVNYSWINKWCSQQASWQHAMKSKKQRSSRENSTSANVLFAMQRSLGTSLDQRKSRYGKLLAAPSVRCHCKRCPLSSGG